MYIEQLANTHILGWTVEWLVNGYWKHDWDGSRITWKIIKLWPRGPFSHRCKSVLHSELKGWQISELWEHCVLCSLVRPSPPSPQRFIIQMRWRKVAVLRNLVPYSRLYRDKSMKALQVIANHNISWKDCTSWQGFSHPWKKHIP